MSRPLTVSAADWLSLGILSILWGSSFFFTKIAVEEIPFLTLVLARIALAAPVILFLAWLTGRAIPGPRRWPAFAVLGLCNNAIPFSLIFWSQTHIASGLASILNATTPLFTLLMAHFLTADDRFSRVRVAGLGVGFAGVTVMIGPGLLGALGTHLYAELACLLAAWCYGVGGIYGRRFRNEHPLTIASGQLITSVLIMTPVVFVADRPWTLALPSQTALAATVALAILSTALAYLFFFRVLASAGATNVMLVTLLIPVSAILLGTLVLGEMLTAAQIAGAGAIALALAIIDGRPAGFLATAFRKRRKPLM
jgi:drug/metabolite transporter (DMT)-like permease